jgi:hypothetical protein
VQNGHIDDKLHRYLNFHVDFDTYLVGGAHPVCVFVGYWDVPKSRVDTGDDEVKCSYYKNVRTKNAVLWLLNTGDTEKTLDKLVFSSDVIGRDNDCHIAFDAEDGKPVEVVPAPGEHKFKTYLLKTPITIKRHEFRAIAIGPEE